MVTRFPFDSFDLLFSKAALFSTSASSATSFSVSAYQSMNSLLSSTQVVLASNRRIAVPLDLCLLPMCLQSVASGKSSGKSGHPSVREEDAAAKTDLASHVCAPPPGH